MIVLENTDVQICGGIHVRAGLVGQSLLVFKVKEGRLKRFHLFAEAVYFTFKSLCSEVTPLQIDPELVQFHRELTDLEVTFGLLFHVELTHNRKNELEERNADFRIVLIQKRHGHREIILGNVVIVSHTVFVVDPRIEHTRRF